MFAERFWRWYDRAARLDFGGNLLALVFDWRTWLLGLGSSAVTFIGTANQGWDPWAVWLAALAAGALVSLIMVTVRVFWRLGSKEAKGPHTDLATSNEFASDIPDVRVADDTVAWGLFGRPQCDKLLPLLERGKIEAWGRLGNHSPPLTLIPSAQWTTHYLDNRLDDTPGRINQTFFRPRSRPYESTYHDIHLNRNQLERAWPGLWAQPFRIPLQEFLHIEAVKSGWLARPGETANDLSELIKKIRQAAIDDDLHLWGKQTHMSWHAQALNDAPLLAIDKQYWRDHEIDYLRAIFYDKGNNGTRSQREYAGSDHPQEQYYDLHLGREEALNWLRSPDGRPTSRVVPSR